MSAFPKSKLIVRGEEIITQGTQQDIQQIHHLLKVLIAHCEKEGNLSSHDLDTYLHLGTEASPVTQKDKDSVIIHGLGSQPIFTQSEHQAALFRATQLSDLVFATGPSGSGKTFLAVAIALRALRRKEVKRIIITRPAVEAGEHLGFLPGDLTEKMDPYLRPIYDVLREILPEERLRFFREKGILEIAPLAYMRGRTLSDSFILLDEAQNATPLQLKMFLTRLGPHSKAIVTGDTSQIDLPPDKQSGLVQGINCLKNITEVSFITLDATDVMRHPLVRQIVKAYASHQQSKS